MYMYVSIVYMYMQTILFPFTSMLTLYVHSFVIVCADYLQVRDDGAKIA